MSDFDFGPPGGAKPAGGEFDFGPAASQPEEPGFVESGLRGAAQGVTLGFADEITGGAEALLAKLTGSHEKLVDLYHRSRDESRSNYKKAQDENPVAYGAAELAGGLAPLAIPGAGAVVAGRGLAGAVGGGAALGAAAGLGHSEAEDARGMIEDTAVSGLVGGAAGAAGQAMGRLLARAGQAVGGRAAAASDRLAAAAQAKGAQAAADEAASLTGAHGAKVREAVSLTRDLEADAAGRAGLVTSEHQAAAKAALEHPELRDLAARQVQRRVEAAPQIADEVRAAKNAAEFARNQTVTPPALGADLPAAQDAARAAVVGAGRRVARQAVVPLAGAAIGAVTGEDPLKGGLVGAIGAESLTRGAGRPIMRAAQGLMRNPAVRRTAFDKLAQVARMNPAALGKWGGYLAQAAGRGTDALATAHFALSQTDTDYAARARAALDGGGGDE